MTAKQTFRAYSPADILQQMARIIRTHAGDMAPHVGASLLDLFRMVSAASYTREPHEWGAQVLARPRWILSKVSPIVACASKAILVSSWAELQGIPWRLVAVGKRPGQAPHHVFPELYLWGRWRPVDATYPWSVIFTEKDWPVRLVLEGRAAT